MEHLINKLNKDTAEYAVGSLKLVDAPIDWIYMDKLNEQLIAASYSKGCLCVINNKAEEPVKTFNLDVCSVVAGENWLALGCNDGTVLQWSLAKLHTTYSFQRHSSNITNIVCHGNFIVSTSKDFSIRVFQAYQSSSMINPVSDRLFSGHTAEITAMVIAPRTLYSPTVLFSGSKDNTIRQWDLEANQCLRVLTGHQGWIDRLAHHDKHLFSAARDGTVRIWDSESGKLIHKIEVGGIVTQLLPTFGEIYVSFSNSITSWSTKSWKVTNSFRGHMAKVRNLCVDSEFLFSGSMDLTAKKWSRKNGASLAVFGQYTQPINVMTVDEGILYTGDMDGFIRAWMVSDNNNRKEEDRFRWLRQKSLSCDGFDLPIKSKSEEENESVEHTPGSPDSGAEEKPDYSLTMNNYIGKLNTHVTRVMNLMESKPKPSPDLHDVGGVDILGRSAPQLTRNPRNNKSTNEGEDSNAVPSPPPPTPASTPATGMSNIDVSRFAEIDWEGPRSKHTPPLTQVPHNTPIVDVSLTPFLQSKIRPPRNENPAFFTKRYRRSKSESSLVYNAPANKTPPNNNNAWTSGRAALNRPDLPKVLLGNAKQRGKEDLS